MLFVCLFFICLTGSYAFSGSNFYNRDVIHKEMPCHDARINAIHKAVFTSEQFARASFRVRDEGEHAVHLSRIGIIDSEIVASVRLTPILISDTSALLLGPLVVLPQFRCRRLGSLLMQECLEASKKAGYRLVILVGDELYYGQFGFKPLPVNTVFFPGWVDQKRILACELEEKSAQNISGMVRHSMPLHNCINVRNPLL
jgi:predicted N-acetyltransferase YhbS